MGRPRGVLCLLLCIAVAPAQARAPFTGVIRSASGQPLAAARVTCVHAPSDFDVAEPERRTAVTDADGRFSLELCTDRFYCVYAIGPAGPDRSREVVAPSFTAVGGRHRELIATSTEPPRKLAVNGVQPWVAEGPPRLRFFVARGVAVEPDLVLPGDGPVTVPPLPTTMVTLAVLDGRQQVVDWLELDLAAVTSCTFHRTIEIDFRVTAPAGIATAGVQIVHQPYLQHPHGPAIGFGNGWMAGERIVAVTGADGVARGRCVLDLGWRPLFFARGEGSYSECSGWWPGHRIENNQEIADEGPVRLQLKSHDVVASAVSGLDPSSELLVRQMRRLRVNLNGAQGSMRLQHAQWRAPAAATGLQLAQVESSQLTAVAFGSGPLPSRTILQQAVSPEVPLDFAALRPVSIQVVDAERRAVPFAAVGVTKDGTAWPVPWITSLVTDAEGRAEVRLAAAEVTVYAQTPTADGAIVVAAGAEPAEATVVLTPRPMVRIRVVDARGEPIAGARIAPEPGSNGSIDDGLEQIDSSGCCPSDLELRTDRDGYLVLPRPRSAFSRAVRATANGQHSERALITRDTETLELRINR